MLHTGWLCSAKANQKSMTSIAVSFSTLSKAWYGQCAYRRSRGLWPTPSRANPRSTHPGRILARVLAWTRSRVETSHILQEAAAIWLRDLERQLFEQPAALQQFWSRLFSCLFQDENISTSTSNESTNEDSSNSYGTPERPYISQSQISIADGTDSTITTHDSSSTSPAQSVDLFETSTLDGVERYDGYHENA